MKAKHENTETITLTFGDQGENHVGMQKIGVAVERGFSIEDLNRFKSVFEERGGRCELVDLARLIPRAEAAQLLIVRGGV